MKRYDSYDAQKVGHQCSSTYLTGGRPPLSLVQMAILAGDLASACCASLPAQRDFVKQFQQG